MTEMILATMFLIITVGCGGICYRAGSIVSYDKGFSRGYADGCKDGEFLAVIRRVSQ